MGGGLPRGLPFATPCVEKPMAFRTQRHESSAPPLCLGAATLDGPIVFNNNIDHVDTLEIEMNVIWISSPHMLFSNWGVGGYLELNNVS